ncbi:MAG: hypothetical protein LBG27_03485 [Spirochaetaceae bacterium]|nr:hypothetical protein [Spirochaetaceae bacterium]
MAAITGLVAKENVTGTMGVLYGFAEVSEEGAEIWGAFAVSYQLVYDYMLGLIIYLLGTFFADGGFGIGTMAGFAVLALLVFLFVRKPGKATRPSGIRDAA